MIFKDTNNNFTLKQLTGLHFCLPSNLFVTVNLEFIFGSAPLVTTHTNCQAQALQANLGWMDLTAHSALWEVVSWRMELPDEGKELRRYMLKF